MTSKFCPLGVVSYIHLLNHEKMCIKSEAEEIFLQQMTKVTRHSCWCKKFGPNGLSVPAQGLCTCTKSWKNVHVFFFKTCMIRPFCFHQNIDPLALGLYIHHARNRTCCQNLYQVVVCPCPGIVFKWWPWADLDHFYDKVRFVSWCFFMGDSLYNIERPCISKFVLIQHILCTQASYTGPMVLCCCF